MSVEAEKYVPDDTPSSDEGRRGSVLIGTVDDLQVMDKLGYKPELQRNRSMFTLLFQSLAIAAIPYGEGAPIINAIYGGGPLSIFVGWLMVLVLDECVALSLGELASKYPTSAGQWRRCSGCTSDADRAL